MPANGISLTRLEEALGFKANTSNLLYALCDFQTLLKKDLLLNDFIELALKFDAKIIQYRDKINTNETQIENLIYLKKKLNIPIIINDKIELNRLCPRASFRARRFF